MKPRILALDQSTSASKAFLLDERGDIVARSALAHRQSYPRHGYVEQDAGEIWRNAQSALKQTADGNVPLALAICNQRETVVVWDRRTGEPLGPAISWQDTRAEGWCRSHADMADTVRGITGMDLSPYYSAAKAGHVLRQNPQWKARACVGTMDSYLVYRLTEGRVFRTDVSNASRTQLMNLQTLAWDAGLCDFFGIPMDCLPEIVPCDADFGRSALGIPITGVMGDSHAALFGQGCRVKGLAKATYGTGSSVMQNIGRVPQAAPPGLATSVAYGFDGHTDYVLEGNVTSSGDTLQWLVTELGLFRSVEEIQALAQGVPDAGGVSLVPAFSGLGAPHQAEAARALLCGMSRGTGRAHIASAALESIAHQNADILEAMGVKPSSLRADGAPTRNPLLMQMQADLLGCPVQCAARSELSALGAGMMAGMAVGLYNARMVASPAALYTPKMDEETRKAQRRAWRAAVCKAIS